MCVSIFSKKTMPKTIKKKGIRITGVFFLLKDCVETLCISMPATKNGVAFQNAKIPIHCKKSRPVDAWGAS